MSANEHAVLMDNDKISAGRGKVARGYCVGNKCCSYIGPWTKKHTYVRQLYRTRVFRVELEKPNYTLKCEDCGGDLFWKTVRYANDLEHRRKRRASSQD